MMRLKDFHKTNVTQKQVSTAVLTTVSGFLNAVGKVADLDDVYSSTAFALKELLCRHTLDVDDNLNRAASSLALGSRGQLVFLNFLDLRGSSVACKKLINPEKDSFNLESKGSMKETPMTAALYEIGAQEVTLSMVLAMVYAESEVRGHMGLDDPMDKDNHVVGPASKGITWVEVVQTTWEWMSSLYDKQEEGISKEKGHLNSLFYCLLYHAMYAVLSGLVVVDAGRGFCKLTSEGNKLLNPEKSFAPATKAILKGAASMQNRAEYERGLQAAAARAVAWDPVFRGKREAACLKKAANGNERERAAVAAARVRKGTGGTEARGLPAFFKRMQQSGGAVHETAGESSVAASKENQPGGRGNLEGEKENKEVTKKRKEPQAEAGDKSGAAGSTGNGGSGPSSAAGGPKMTKQILDKIFEEEKVQEAGEKSCGVGDSGGVASQPWAGLSEKVQLDLLETLGYDQPARSLARMCPETTLRRTRKKLDEYNNTKKAKDKEKEDKRKKAAERGKAAKSASKK